VAKRAAPLLLLLLPIACAAPDPADPAVLLQEALATHQAGLEGMAPRAPCLRRRAGGGARPATRDPHRRHGGGRADHGGQLVGQPPEALTRILGQPRLRRDEGAAQVWHYQAPQCHLDLVLYREDGPQPGFRVAFASARAVGTARRGEAACLRDISRGAALRPSPDRVRGDGGSGRVGACLLALAAQGGALPLDPHLYWVGEGGGMVRPLGRAPA
jgi:hypothetical protein